MKQVRDFDAAIQAAAEYHEAMIDDLLDKIKELEHEIEGLSEQINELLK